MRCRRKSVVEAPVTTAMLVLLTPALTMLVSQHQLIAVTTTFVLWTLATPIQVAFICLSRDLLPLSSSLRPITTAPKHHGSSSRPIYPSLLLQATVMPRVHPSPSRRPFVPIPASHSLSRTPGATECVASMATVVTEFYLTD